MFVPKYNRVRNDHTTGRQQSCAHQPFAVARFRINTNVYIIIPNAFAKYSNVNR